MRLMTGWLLLVSVVLLSADGLNPDRTARCCCAAMAKGTCPLRQRSHPACDARAHCSMSQPSRDDVQSASIADSRDTSTLIETPHRLVPPSIASGLAPIAIPLTSARTAAPETPPPRLA